MKKIQESVDLLCLFLENGWEVKTGVSKNNKHGRDDLIAKEIYSKTYKGNHTYIIQLDRLPAKYIEKKICKVYDIGVLTDATWGWNMRGIEKIGDKIMSSANKEIISINPYLDALDETINCMAILDDKMKDR